MSEWTLSKRARAAGPSRSGRSALQHVTAFTMSHIARGSQLEYVAVDGGPMTKVSVEPNGLCFEAEEDETIMGAAQRCGLEWPNVCGGRAECKACYVLVVAGADGLQPPSDDEDSALELIRRRHRSDSRPARLACQARILSDVTVFKRGVAPAADGNAKHAG